MVCNGDDTISEDLNEPVMIDTYQSSVSVIEIEAPEIIRKRDKKELQKAAPKFRIIPK